MKKKILIVLASILVVCVSGLTLTACKHEHSFTGEKIVAPTCTERGYVLKICDCGEEQIDESSYVDKIEHDYNNGFCVDCGSSVMDAVYNLEYGSIEDDDSYVLGSPVKEFIDKVKNSRTGGGVDYETYGADINIIGCQVKQGVTYNDNYSFKIAVMDGVLKGSLVADCDYGQTGVENSKNDSCYFIDRLSYLSNGEVINDYRNDSKTLEDYLYNVIYSFSGYEYSAANLVAAYENLYSALDSSYYVAQVDDYQIFKVVFTDQYMGVVRALYVYDSEYNLLGFKAENSMGNNYQVEISISPLKDGVEIPQAVVDKINSYKEQNPA